MRDRSTFERSQALDRDVDALLGDKARSACDKKDRAHGSILLYGLAPSVKSTWGYVRK